VSGDETNPTAGSTSAVIVGSSPVDLWGIDGRERLRRQLRASGVTEVDAGGESRPLAASVLALRADFLFDDRTLRDLLTKPGPIVLTAGGGNVAAAKVPAARFADALAVVEGRAAADSIDGVRLLTSTELSSAFVGELKKASASLVLPVRRERKSALEVYLFDGSYKGTTDLVTKWLWPTPARWVTGLCTRLGIVPNAVTSVSLLLALTVIGLFAQGSLSIALLLAWTMTFLDTVDGKLARVTVTSTEFGHFFDHLIDLIHPPLWYAAWAYGSSADPAEFQRLVPALVVMLVAYIAGRLLEGLFKTFLCGFTIFVWRPFDSYFRLILARRNPCLLLLTGAALLGQPLLGLHAVVVWTVVSTLVLAVRVLQAMVDRMRGVTPRPWLETLRLDDPRRPLWWRPFVPDPALYATLAD